LQIFAYTLLFVQLPKAPKPQAQQIDRSQSYPCPCSKRGKLNPITLTDAFGCDRCSLIFASEDDGYSLVQLGGIDPYLRAWYWNGTRWQAIRNANFKYARELAPIQLVLVSSVVLMFLLLVAVSTKNFQGLHLTILIAIPVILVFCWLILLRRREP
jgi:uncharacterized protein (DUF983 family)